MPRSGILSIIGVFTLYHVVLAVQQEFYIEVRNKEIQSKPSTKSNFSVLCSHVDTCQREAGELCDYVSGIQYLVSCPKVGYHSAVVYCNSKGGHVIRNSTSIGKTLETLENIKAEIFYSCKKFWICCYDCTKDNSNPIAHVKQTPLASTGGFDYFYDTTTESFSSESSPPQEDSATTPRTKGSTDEKGDSRLIIIVTVVIILVLCAVILFLLRNKIKARWQQHCPRRDTKDKQGGSEEGEALMKRGTQSQNTKLANGIAAAGSRGSGAEGDRALPERDGLADRQKQFNNSNYPIQDNLFRQNLALMGLVPTNNGDQVRCEFCGIELSDWKEDDEVFEVHKKGAPNCPLILYMEANTKPLEANIKPLETVEQAQPDVT